MLEFVLGQKWIMSDAVFGTFMAEVIEVSDAGGWGAVMMKEMSLTRLPAVPLSSRPPRDGGLSRGSFLSMRTRAHPEPFQLAQRRHDAF